VDAISFPHTFLWGAASSAHQGEGGNMNNQWYLFENSINPKTNKSYIADGSKSGLASDQYYLYDQDIQRMKNELHLSAYRFSIEWSRIQPQQGQYNKTEILHYHNLIDALIANDIEPLVTMHYVTDPIWYTDLGSWTKEENIQYFVEYCTFLHNEYSSKVKYWMTISEPNAYALEGWSDGSWAPGIVNDDKMAATVMINMAKAHVQVYETIKGLSGGNQSQIGIVLNLQQFDPANATNPLDRMISGIVNGVFSGTYLGFFKDGHFKFDDGSVKMEYTDPKAPSTIDFFGLNYFGNAYVKFNFLAPNRYELVNTGPDTLADNGWPIYPEGIYRAIKTLAPYNKTIIVTENGLADSKDIHRELFIKRYIYAISKAISEGGVNVIGYCHWSLTDMFQWDAGFTSRMGLYEVDYQTQQRSLRNSAKSYISIIKRFRSTAVLSTTLDEINLEDFYN
jgi:beta-glucosidase